MTERVVTTNLGLQLLTKLASSVGQLKFMRAAVGTGTIPEGTDPSQLTDLVTYKMDAMIADYGFDTETNDGYVVIQLSNTNVRSGFVMTELGLYAADPDNGQLLYAYVDLSKDPNYIMPAENGRSKTVQFKLHIIVGEVNNITAVINPLSQVTKEVFEKELNNKVNLVVMEQDIPVAERVAHTWYLKVTDMQSYRSMRTSPSMGVRIIGMEDAVWKQD